MAAANLHRDDHELAKGCEGAGQGAVHAWVAEGEADGAARFRQLSDVTT
jgi:hypothetical protein